MATSSRAASQRISVVSAPKGNKNAVGNKGYTPKPDGFKPEHCLVAKAMCKMGALDHEIAEEIGISNKTFYRWKAKHIEFATAIERGKEVADKMVEQSLFKNAVGYEYEEEEAKVVGNGPHAVLQKTFVRKTKHGETSAQSLWLRNRKPDQWRERQESVQKIEISDRFLKLLEHIETEGKKNRERDRQLLIDRYNAIDTEFGSGRNVTDPREAIAYHEAGHAVISMKLGYKCLYVTIIPDGSRLGHVCCEDPLIGGHDDKIKHALKVLIAASLAEGKHLGSPTWGDAEDRARAKNLALLVTYRDTERADALINDMIGKTRELVEQYWPEINMLAQRLLVNGKLNFLEVGA